MRLSDAFSVYYLLLLQASLGEYVDPEVRNAALRMVTDRLTHTSAETAPEWFPLMRYLSYPESITLLRKVRPELLHSLELQSRSTPMSGFRMMANFGAGRQPAYFAQTIYGSPDLLASVTAIAGKPIGQGDKGSSIFFRTLKCQGR
jgi:hypothetical protein